MHGLTWWRICVSKGGVERRFFILQSEVKCDSCRFQVATRTSTTPALTSCKKLMFFLLFFFFKPSRVVTQFEVWGTKSNLSRKLRQKINSKIFDKQKLSIKNKGKQPKIRWCEVMRWDEMRYVVIDAQGKK